MRPVSPWPMQGPTTYAPNLDPSAKIPAALAAETALGDELASESTNPAISSTTVWPGLRCGKVLRSHPKIEAGISVSRRPSIRPLERHGTYAGWGADFHLVVTDDPLRPHMGAA